jgi:hypothetical protein
VRVRAGNPHRGDAGYEAMANAINPALLSS